MIAHVPTRPDYVLCVINEANAYRRRVTMCDREPAPDERLFDDAGEVFESHPTGRYMVCSACADGMKRHVAAMTWEGTTDAEDE